MMIQIRTRTSIRELVAATASALLVLLAMAPGAAQAELSAKSYAVKSVCPAPSPGHATCLALRLLARGSQTADAHTRSTRAPARSPGASPAIEHPEPLLGSLSPADLQNAYGLASVAPPAATQTIGIVDAFDDATIEADLAHYSSEFGLPPCTFGSGCFRKVNQAGNSSPLPASKGVEERGWAQEIATDVELAHAICPSCHILLVEASSTSYANLFAAENTAVNLGANEISNSWAGQSPASKPPPSTTQAS